MKTENIIELYKRVGTDSANINSLVSAYLQSLANLEDGAIHKRLLEELVEKYVLLEKRVDSLLKNTLPKEVADIIKYEGRFIPLSYNCTILFTDFVKFTKLAEGMSSKVLIEILDNIFRGFDDQIQRFRGTKIKTIGDSYMAVFGAPIRFKGHASMAVNAALSLMDFLEAFNKERGLEFQMRVGIHTGEVMAGVVGKERMQFDIFGDTVNTASRFESSGEKGRVNISETTYMEVKDLFAFEERGYIKLKNKENMKAYFIVKG